MKIRYSKESKRAVCPRKMTAGAAGYDLFARVGVVIPPGATRKVPLGIFLEIPEGIEAQVRPRGSLSAGGIFGQLGTIDSDYRGEVFAVCYNSTTVHYTVEKDQRIAQLVIALVESKVEWEECDYNDLSHTERGQSGFGSTGRGGANGD